MPGTCANIAANLVVNTSSDLATYMASASYTGNGKLGPFVKASFPANSACYTFTAPCTSSPQTSPCGIIPDGPGDLR